MRFCQLAPGAPWIQLLYPDATFGGSAAPFNNGLDATIDGWFFGLDISYAELVAEMALGFPFTGPFSSEGATTIGPFSGLPSGLTVYAVALGFAPGSTVPTEVSAAVSHAIP